MKKRNLIIVVIASVFTLIFVLPSAWADSHGQYRGDGVVIGAGAAVAGSASLNNYLYSRPPTRVVCRYAGPHRHRYYSGPRYRRYWAMRNRWARNHHYRPWHHRHYHPYGRTVR